MDREQIQLNMNHAKIIAFVRKMMTKSIKKEPTSTVVIEHCVIPLFEPSTKTYRKWNPKTPSQWIVYICSVSKHGILIRKHVRYFYALYSDIERIMYEIVFSKK